MIKLITTAILALTPALAFAESKSVAIVPNTFSPADQRADAPYVMTINGRFKWTEPDDIRSLAGCYVSGNTAVRTALTALVEPEPGDKTPVNEQLNAVASSLQAAQAKDSARYQMVTTHLSSLSDEVKSALEECLNEE